MMSPTSKGGRVLIPVKANWPPDAGVAATTTAGPVAACPDMVPGAEPALEVTPPMGVDPVGPVEPPPPADGGADA